MTLRNDSMFDRIVDDISYRYANAFSRSEVASQVRRSQEELELASRHPGFLPILVEKHAREHLLRSARSQGRIAKETPEILFVCVHNEGRSQMAAALAEHCSTGHVHVRSAGSHPTGILNPLVVEALRERGIDLAHAYPTALSGDILKAADVVVRMGTNVSTSPGRRDLDWDVADPQHQSMDTVRAIRDDIESRVCTLLRDLDVTLNGDVTPTPTPTPTRRFYLPRIKVGHV